MAKDAVVFACANPTPEIFPEEAKAGGARVVATGRSDYPNQINNVLAFPGVFRGALDVRASDINEEMKMAAAQALAGLIGEEELSRGEYHPHSPLTPGWCPQWPRRWPRRPGRPAWPDCEGSADRKEMEAGPRNNSSAALLGLKICPAPYRRERAASSATRVKSGWY